MPLATKSFYSWREACKLIRQKLPNEDPRKNLVEALCDGLPAWIYDFQTKKRVIPPGEYWRQRDGFNHSLGSARFWDYEKEGPLAKTYAGQIQIEKEALDQLLDSCRVTPTATTVTPTPPRYSPAALNEWFPRYVDEQVEAGNRPTREDDVKAAREALGDGVPRDAVREARKKYAPDEWQRRGAQKKFGKK